MNKQEKNSFSCVYEEYLIFARKNLKLQSFDSTKNKIDLHILPFFKDMDLEDISYKDIINWEDFIISCNFSNNFNKNLYYCLSGFFEFCKCRYDFDKKIISDIGCFKKKYEKDKHDFYTLSDFKQFIKYVDEPIYKQFFNLMFYCGTRPGEAMALKFSDLSNNHLTIDKTMNSHKKREIGTPKTFSSIRTIVIDNQLKKDLLDLKKLYEAKYDKNYDFYIFGGIKPLSASSINRRKVMACEKANIRPITLHQLRHSHATLLISKGMMINEVSRRLGHSKVSTTLDIYTHTDLTQEKRVYDTLNSLRFNIFTLISNKLKNIKHHILKR